VRGVQLGKVLLIAAVIEGIGLVGNAVTSFVTDKANGALRWALPPVVALAAAMAKAVVDAVIAAREPVEPPPVGPHPVGPYPAGPYPVAPAGPTPQMHPHRRNAALSALVAVLVVMVACGGGGFAITAGVRYATGWLTGSETGTDRLVQPASARAGALTLTVQRVVYTSHFTRVELLASNAGDTVSLPLFGNCVLSGGDGTTLRADANRSDWSETLPAGGTQRGTVTFGGNLPDGVTRASLSFSHVFVLGGGSITVSNIMLRT
jgi:hypothetical protein